VSERTAMASTTPRHGRRRAPWLLASGALALAALLAGTTATLGITGGSRDTTSRYPHVGAIVVQVGGGYEQWCSGTLIAARVFLTAAHCILAVTDDDDDDILVTFDPKITASPGTHVGTGHTHPRYRGTYQYDLAVVVFDEDVTGVSPALLPSQGLLDQLNRQKVLRKTKFTLVGYGQQAMQVEPGTGPTFPETNERSYAQVAFSALDKQFLHQTQNAARGLTGGACGGDSGGPSFLWKGASETNTLVAVTSAGDWPCYATNVAARMDTKSALDFVNGFLD
jgi:secreted trypsin-like serine protease